MRPFSILFTALGLVLFCAGCAVMEKAMVKTGEMTGDNELVKAAGEMTPQQEYYLGRSIAAEILSKYPLHKSEELNRYVNTLGQYLVLHSSRPNTFKGYQFAVVEMDSPSAMSAPSGYVFISSGLLKKASDEDELAAVLAHEIAHIVFFHAQEIIKKENTMKSLTKYGSMLAAIATQGTVSQEQGDAFGKLVGRGLNVKFNKDQESDADREAKTLLQHAGYDPAALASFIAKMDDKADFLSRHPANKNRLKALQEVGDAYAWSATRTARTQRYQKYLASL